MGQKSSEGKKVHNSFNTLKDVASLNTLLEKSVGQNHYQGKKSATRIFSH